MNKLFEKDKQKRTITILVVGLGFSALVWVMLGLGDNDEKKNTPAPTVNLIKKEETLEEGFKSRFGQDLLTLQNSNSKMSKDVEELKTKAEQLENENKKLKTEVSIANSIMSEAIKTPPPANDEFSGVMSVPPAPSTTASKPRSNSTGAYPEPNATQPVVTVVTGLISVGQPIGGINADKPKDAPKVKKDDLTIPAGSFVKASLLSGVIAPTMGQGASDPVPVLINVTGITQLPNFFKADIKNCFLLAETRGNLATETVSFRLKSLACKKSDGTTVEKTVDGYVTGENGVEGLQGRVVSKQGALIARSFAAEFLGGMAKAFEESGKTVSTTGSGLVTTFDPNKALQTGLFSGASGAFSRVSEFYMDLADNMVPVIEINAGRKVDVVFIKSVNFDSKETDK